MNPTTHKPIVLTPEDEALSQAYLTKADIAYDRVRRWILTGRLGPGQRLDQDWLASALGISRMPLRQAMLRLTAEGLIEARPHHSAIVRGLSPIELEDLYEARRAIEGMLAETGTRRHVPEDVKAMTRVLEEQERAVRDSNYDRFVELDRDFHFRLYRATGYERACEIVERLHDSTQRYVRVYADQVRGATASLGEHGSILEGVRTGDAPGVRVHVERHIRRGLESLQAAAAAAAAAEIGAQISDGAPDHGEVTRR